MARVKVHQTKDTGALKGGVRGAAIGVVVGAIIAGPAGAVAAVRLAASSAACTTASTTSASTTSSCAGRDEIEKGKSALFVLYEGIWSASIGPIEERHQGRQRAADPRARCRAEKAAALRALVEPAAEVLGGEEVVADFEVEVEEPEEAAAAPRKPPGRCRRRPPPGNGAVMPTT